MSLPTPRCTLNISPTKHMRHSSSTGQVSTTSHHQFPQQQQQQQQHAHPWIHQFMQTKPQQQSHQQHGQSLPSQQASSLSQHEMVSQHILGSSPSSQSNTGVSTNSFYIPVVNIPSSLSISPPSSTMMSPASLLSAQYGLVQPMVYQTSSSQQQVHHSHLFYFSSNLCNKWFLGTVTCLDLQWFDLYHLIFTQISICHNLTGWFFVIVFNLTSAVFSANSY